VEDVSDRGSGAGYTFRVLNPCGFGAWHRTHTTTVTAMPFLDDRAVAEALPWPELIVAVEGAMVASGAAAPDRTVHTIDVPGGAPASLLVKPGWIVGDVIAVKTVTFFPDNGAVELPTVHAGVLLFSATDGRMLGACEGNELTTRRTAAASAVAAKRLARTGVDRLLVVGTGALAPRIAEAHAQVRDYASIEIWGRSADKAAAVVAELRDLGLPADISNDLDASVAAADTISCVTGTTEPLVKGALLKPGAHVDLVGAFTAAMRESDDAVMERGDIWVDTRADGVISGDLAQPLAAGLITADDIQGDLAELIAGTCPGRTSDDQITVFKSAGSALEDLAAAKLLFE